MGAIAERTEPRRQRPAADFLAFTAEPVREWLLGSVAVEDFPGAIQPLTLDERIVIVDQALLLLEENYVHLPFKVAMHGINPIRRLKLLRRRIECLRSDEDSLQCKFPDEEFHEELSSIFHSVRDLHTTYLLPEPYQGMIAYLPFLIEEYEDNDGRHYVVSNVVPGFGAAAFARGVEVTHWSGVPIARAVDLHAHRFAGSNTAARHARAIESLTLRSLNLHLPPDEEWVTISYIGTDGVKRELRGKWLVVKNLPPHTDNLKTATANEAAIGLDIGTDELGRARRLLFAPYTLRQAHESQPEAHASPNFIGDDEVVQTTMPGVFQARGVTTPSGKFGHVRIYTFHNIPDVESFVSEFIRLIELLPQNGLIIDVRGNGGGYVAAGERILQTLTSRHIKPAPFQFFNSSLNLALCRSSIARQAGIELSSWIHSIEQSLETGEVFSAAFPLTTETEANAIGQTYQAPALVITDARCYSATDIFAAGFKDHEIGKVLGVDETTGAGGANVWQHWLLRQLLEDGGDRPYRPLPKGVGLSVAIRRTLRVGRLAGTPLEDLGVAADEFYKMTRDDVLYGNRRLLDRAGELLAAMPVRRLQALATLEGDTLSITLQAAGLNRVDVFVDDRPRESVDISGPSVAFTVVGVPGARTVRLEGFTSGEGGPAHEPAVSRVLVLDSQSSPNLQMGARAEGTFLQKYLSCVSACLPVADSGARRACLEQCQDIVPGAPLRSASPTALPRATEIGLTHRMRPRRLLSQGSFRTQSELRAKSARAAMKG